MPNLTSITIANGVPTVGTGAVSTIDALMADGGQATLGAKADAASVATDTTPVSSVSIWKQISKSVQAIATSLTASLPLPTGAALESGGNLATLAGAVSSAKVSTKAADGDIATVGALADAAYVSGSGSVVALLKGIFAKLAGSLAVTGTFWQATQPVSIAALPALAAGSNTIGAVNGVTTRVSVVPTVTAATYALSKVVGGIMSFANILPASLGGVLQSITLKFKGSVQTVGFWVAVFDTSPGGTFTDTNTAAILAADSALLVGLYHLTTPVSVLGTHTVYNLDGIGKAFVGASTSLFIVVVPDATTAALGSATDMTATLGVLWG